MKLRQLPPALAPGDDPRPAHDHGACNRGPGHRARRLLNAPWRALRVAALCVASGCSVHADFAATGGAAGSVSHLWVTVEGIWVATAADTLPESTSGWLQTSLPSPVTLDLATLTPGTLAALATAVSLPAGTYKQVHLVTADSADAIGSSASAAGLTYNSQITVSDTSGTLTTAPLESPVPEGGITIPTDITLSGTLDLGQSSTNPTSTSTSTGSTTSTNSTGSTSSTGSTATLAVTLDGARDVLSYTYGTTTGYILSPVASVADESLAGGISGSVDPSALAAGHGPVAVSAEIPDPGNTHHVVVQRRVVGPDGTFTLYPLPAPSSGTTTYDLVISCSGAETVLLRGIPVSSSAVTSATVAQSTPIVLASASSVYADVSATETPLLPGGARVMFYETVAGSGEIPYGVDGTAVDPVTHRLPGDAFALSMGPLMVGNYASGGPVSFSTAAPLEGNGGYVIGTEGLYRADTLATSPTVVTGTSAAATPVTAPYPRLPAGAVAGTISVVLAAPPGEFDSGFVVVSAGNRVVETTNVGALLNAGGGTVLITHVPGGSALASSTGVPYQVAVRAWLSTNAATSFVRVASTASIVLDNSGTGSVSLQVP